MSFSKHFREERGEVAVNNLEEPLKVVIDEQDFQRKMDSKKKVNDANMGRSNHLRTQKSVIDGGGNVNRIDKLLSRQILGQSVVCSGTTLWSRTQFNSFHPL